MSREIIRAEWQSLGSTAYSGMLRHGNPVFGYVLVKTEYSGYKCYAGIGTGIDEKLDMKIIAESGGRVRVDVASVLFPEVMASEWAKS